MGDFFVKHSYAAMWHFCHNSRGICFCPMSDANLTEYEILMPKGQADFDVLIDDAHVIHLVCQDDTGSIVYLKREGDVWKKHVIMQSKSPKAYQKSFSLHRVGNWINVLYTVDYKGKKLLSHQILENMDVPNAVDTIENDFAGGLDEHGNLYAAYTNTEGIFGYKKFVWARKQWGEFVTLEQAEVKQPYVFVAEKPFFAGVQEGKVVCFADGNKHVVGESGYNPVIVRQKERFYVMWENKRDGRVWAAASGDGFATLKNPTEFATGKFSPVKRIGLVYTTFEDCASRHCYGYIRDNAAVLYVLGDFLTVKRTPPKPAPVSVPARPEETAVEATKLKIQLKQLSDTIEKLEFRVEMLEKKLEIT